MFATVSASVESARIPPWTTPSGIALDNPIFLNIFLRQLNAFKTSPRRQNINPASRAVEKPSAPLLPCADLRRCSTYRDANADSTVHT
jgi:hypothetical protein